MDFASSSQTCGHTGASGPDQSPTRSESSLRRRPRPEVNSERVWGPSLSSVPTFLPTKPLFKSSARAWTTGPSGLGRESERRPGRHKARLTPAPRRRPCIVLREAPDSPQARGGEQVGLRRQAAPSSQTDGEQRGTQRRQRHRSSPHEGRAGWLPQTRAAPQSPVTPGEGSSHLAVRISQPNPNSRFTDKKTGLRKACPQSRVRM